MSYHPGGIEIFYIDPEDVDHCPLCQDPIGDGPDADDHVTEHVGYYWWSCQPGCLPDGEAMGPFDTPNDALEDADDLDVVAEEA